MASSGGGRPRTTIGSKWLVGEKGIGRDQMVRQINIMDNQEQRLLRMENQNQDERDDPKTVEAVTNNCSTGEQKRRRTWEAKEPERKQPGDDTMMLEG
ncbi:unnamed protein product [Cuscuta europaea]|uniref:Uncharacterized protein n=1 Tax=Cuscuta europaea TaxID=41803 RepID=A0A9P0VLX8_CUSEU|nr:unnamed protein product [Cuscuta europaea]